MARGVYRLYHHRIPKRRTIPFLYASPNVSTDLANQYESLVSGTADFTIQYESLISGLVERALAIQIEAQTDVTKERTIQIETLVRTLTNSQLLRVEALTGIVSGGIEPLDQEYEALTSLTRALVSQLESIGGLARALQIQFEAGTEAGDFVVTPSLAGITSITDITNITTIS